MPEGQGYSYGTRKMGTHKGKKGKYKGGMDEYSGKYQGTTKSDAQYAYGNMMTGNYGKAIGDKGKTNPIGNRRTKADVDRYK